MKNTKAPPFFKIKYSNHAKKDANHVKYIGTRPGVEKIPVKSELAEDAAHIEYAGVRPRSTGLFGPDPNKQPILAEAMKEVGNRETTSSWRIVFSLREDDARELGVTDLNAWQDLTRRSMIRFIQSIGMKAEEVRWVGAHHPEQGHPHVHVLAWVTNEAPRRKGELSSMELRDARRGVTQEVFGPLRAKLAAERTIARTTMLDMVKDNVKDAGRVLQKIELEAQIADPTGEKLPPKFTKQEQEILTKDIEELAKIMPGKGQAKLAYMPVEVKAKARTIAEWILSRPQMAGALASYEKATRELTGLYTKKAGRGDEAWRNAYGDLRDRVANVVIRAVATVDRDGRLERSQIYRHDIECNTLRSVWRTLEKERLRAEAKARLASLQVVEQVEEEGKKRSAKEFEGRFM